MSSEKKNYISAVVKEFVPQVNIGGKQQFFWVKPLMAMVSGVPYLTLKDDLSVLSKYMEAVTKGAPENIARDIVKAVAGKINQVYGVKK